VNDDGRIARRFARLRRENRAGLVTFFTAGDPDATTSQQLLERLPSAGADLIELGMPFTDPMADGPAIQASSLRALKAGQTLCGTLDMVHRFRTGDVETPLVLMGYYNPVYVFGVDAFVRQAAAAGVDGLIVVDLPPEEADELRLPAHEAGLDLIFLTAPTTDDARLPAVMAHARGFIYHVAITGVTGTASARREDVDAAIARIRQATQLPVAVGFGIKTPEQAAAMAEVADAAVVGSALVAKIASYIDEQGTSGPALVDQVCAFVTSLAHGVRQARRREPAA
jgi:tryptophan synthase alpha chain